MHTVSKLAAPIGAGGFGAVYYVPSNTFIALKVVKNNTEEHASLLESEFDMMNVVYDSSQQNSQLFQIPLPLALWMANSKITRRRTKLMTEEAAAKLNAQHIEQQFIHLEASNATYAMERIPSLPSTLSQALLQQYSPSNFHSEITLCRLYLGKEAPINRSRFFNSRNFPIDLAAYNWLQETAVQSNLPFASTIVAEMGRMLSTIHNCGFDGRDIEFVVAGCKERSQDHKERDTEIALYQNSSISYEEKSCWAFYTFDFNQMRLLAGNDIKYDVALLSESFFLNDPYFPRPRATSALYQAFKHGYYRALTKRDTFSRTADAFFKEIENIQAEKDQISAEESSSRT